MGWHYGAMEDNDHARYTTLAVVANHDLITVGLREKTSDRNSLPGFAPFFCLALPASLKSRRVYPQNAQNLSTKQKESSNLDNSQFCSLPCYSRFCFELIQQLRHVCPDLLTLVTFHRDSNRPHIKVYFVSDFTRMGCYLGTKINSHENGSIPAAPVVYVTPLFYIYWSIRAL
jgi:hypothetical protein